MRIGIVGGTGREGRGLALRWARKGHEVAIGSRDAERAKARAKELGDAGFGILRGGDNEWAARESEVVLVSVPYSAHADVLRSLKPALEGRILIDITVPLRPPILHQVHLPAGKAAALEAQEIVGDKTTVVAALHHVSSSHLADPSCPIESDVLVCADDEQARDLVIQLIHDLGFRGLDAGPLCNAVALESLTPVLMHLSKKYKGVGAGIRVLGL